MEYVQLDEICNIYSGYAVKKFKKTNNGLPVIKIGNIISDGSLALHECQYTNEVVNEKYYSKIDDIYIALSGATTGKLAIMREKEKYIINQRVGIVRKKENVEIPAEFIKFFLLMQSERMLKEASGCAQPNISPKQIQQYKMPKLKNDEMKNIIDILNKVCLIIENKKRKIVSLDNLIKSRFVEIFGDVFVNNRKWNQLTWNDVLIVKNGKSQKNVEDPEGIYPIYGSGGIMGYANDFLVKENTVIIGRKGNINKPILVKEKYWNVDTAFGLEPNNKYINVDFLFLFCEMYDFKKLNKAVTIPSLTKSDLLKIVIPVPPIELQNQFSDFVEQVNKSKFVVQQSIDELEILYNSLMQEYFG